MYYRSLRAAIFFLLVVAAAGCGSVLSVRYEYDEEIYLELDGSATVYVNASVPALVALRGAPLDVDPRARLDRNDVVQFFTSAVTEVESVTTSRRENRRYVHVRLRVSDIRRLSESPPFAWSRYAFAEVDRLARFRQQVGPSAGRAVGGVGWDGSEMVAFRYHLPSRIPYHNAPSREIERGNIIRWEQPLNSRLKGEPLDIQMDMETESILVQTLSLFTLTALAALATLALAAWWVKRRPGSPVRAGTRPGTATGYGVPRNGPVPRTPPRDRY
jgi:hypothetical protein